MLSHKYAKQIISYIFFSKIRLAINPKNKKSSITNQRELTLALLQLDAKKKYSSLLNFIQQR